MNVRPLQSSRFSAINLLVALSVAACASTLDSVVDTPPLQPVVFTNNLRSTIAIYADRLEMDGVVYPGVGCSTIDFNCIIFDPVGAIVTPRNCTNADAWDWIAGDIRVNFLSFYPHLLDRTLSTLNYPNFGFTFSKDPNIGVWEVYYITHKNSDPGELRDLFDDAGTWSRSSARYEKRPVRADGLALFSCTPQ